VVDVEDRDEEEPDYVDVEKELEWDDLETNIENDENTIQYQSNDDDDSDDDDGMDEEDDE